MEELVLPQGQKQNLKMTSRKSTLTVSQRDLWLVVREGSVADVDLALSSLKKNGGNVNSRNAFGLTLLHIATWRNHIPIVRRLLAAGADPNARDGESGWSSLHRALHFGHLMVASILLQSGASTTLEDSKSRTPVDLLSGPVLQAVGNGEDSVATEVFSWGSGVNYQLGTGNAHIQKLPCKVDSLHGSIIKLISASKFHSVAVSARGEVYTWGFGRGGRLGHPDFDIHSGQAAVITPRLVTAGLGARRVKAVAAAKHHTIVATEGGEVFTWGSNREGQLGYTSVDTQPTPRRVSSLKSKIVAVAAANKHSAVVSESGEVFTWGCNKEGQLGYGTSNSASNYTPRVVEYLKGKVFVRVAAAKYHTIVLGADGEVFTWGHRLVTPRRLVIARNIKKSGTNPLKFHRKERLHVVAIAAGMVHSMALTDDGTLFYWVSDDPSLQCQQLFSLCGRSMVSISAGKYWTASVTSTGDIYMWDGKQGKHEPPTVTRLHGLKRATSVSVGETHLLVIGSLYHPIYPPNIINESPKPKLKVRDELDELDEDFIFGDTKSDKVLSVGPKDDVGNRPIPSLKSLCEKVAAEYLVEPRNAVQLLEIADSLGADDLRKHCEDIAIRNLDYILTVSSHSIASASLDILANLEKSLDSKSSEPWSYRRLPTPTATFPAIINSEEDDSDSESPRTRDNHKKELNSRIERDHRLDIFLQSSDLTNQAISKHVRALRKKLQQIEMLEEKISKGHPLDDQQIAKLQTRPALESSLVELGVPSETLKTKASPSVLPDGRGLKKTEVSKKQRRKSKQKVAQAEVDSGNCETDFVLNPVKGFAAVEISQVQHKESSVDFEGTLANQDDEESPFCIKDIVDVPRSNNSLAKASKKKNKKGGLSVFLSGALEDNHKDAAPLPLTPKHESPAWGVANQDNESPFCIKKDGVDILRSNKSLPKASKKKNKKGGLSMFLSGALEDNPRDAALPPPKPKHEGPAWGGARISKGPASLREIQDQQSRTQVNQHVKGKDLMEDVLDGGNIKKIQLSSFLTSNPIPVVSAARTSQVSDGGTPPWSASETPPLHSRPSLRDIQLQQVAKQGKHQQNLSHSPKTRTTGFSVTTGQGSPSDSVGLNRWYKPETDTPSSIRSIQIEEKAIKDLKRFYSSVKIVKNDS